VSVTTGMPIMSLKLVAVATTLEQSQNEYGICQGLPQIYQP